MKHRDEKQRRVRLPPQVRRRQILDTAVRLFFTVGYEGASLRDLAAEVGINKATIYHYFDSKEEILFHIVDEVGNSLYQGLLDCTRQPGRPIEVLQAMVRFQITYMKDNLEEIKVLVEEHKSLAEGWAEKTRLIQADVLKLYEKVIQECMDAGEMGSYHLATAAFCILGPINWLYHWYRPDGELTIDRLAEEVSEILFHGLGARK